MWAPQVVKKVMCWRSSSNAGSIKDLRGSRCLRALRGHNCSKGQLWKGKVLHCEFAGYNNFIVWIPIGKRCVEISSVQKKSNKETLDELKKLMANDWFVNMLLTPVQLSVARKEVLLLSAL